MSDSDVVRADVDAGEDSDLEPALDLDHAADHLSSLVRSKVNGSRRQIANAKNKTVAKSHGKPGSKQGHGGDNGGASRKTKDAGKRHCPGCQKHMNVIDFPAGSKWCFDDKRAVANLSNAAKEQDRTPWWEAILTCPKKLKKTLAMYHKRHPKVEGKRPKAPVVLEFIEEHRHEQQLLREGHHEMMCERVYLAWMAKPKNGPLDAFKAKSRFVQLCEADNAITDSDGPDPDNRKQVAVRTKNLIINREADILSQSLKVTHCSNRKATSADIDRAEHRLQTQGMTQLQGKLSVKEKVRNMQKASRAQSDGDEIGGFSTHGKASLGVGPLTEYISEDEPGGPEDDADDEEENGDDGGDEGGEVPAAGSGDEEQTRKKKLKVDKIWYNRDDQITTALRMHADWIAATTQKLQACYEDMHGTSHSITEQITSEVENEKKLFNTRYLALKLVLGGGSRSSRPADGDDVSVTPTDGAPRAPSGSGSSGDSSGDKANVESLEKELNALVEERNVVQEQGKVFKKEFDAAHLESKAAEAKIDADGAAVVIDGADANDANAAGGGVEAFKLDIVAKKFALETAMTALKSHVNALLMMNGIVDSKKSEIAALEAGKPVALAENNNPSDGKEEKLETSSAISRLILESGTPERALKKYIAGFRVGDRTKLGDAPPCRSFQSLRTLQEFEAIRRQIMASGCKTQLTDIQQMWKPFKAALNDLLTMSKAADKRLASAAKKAIEGSEKVRATVSQSHASRKKDQQTKNSSKAILDIFEFASSFATAIDSVRFADAGTDRLREDQLSRPLLITLAENHAMVTSAQPHGISMAKKFLKDPARVRPGRCQKYLAADFEKQVQEFCENELLPVGYHQAVGPFEAIKESMNVFAVALEVETCSAEAGHCPCFRFCIKGSRHVILTPFMTMVKWLSKSIATSTLQPKLVYNHFKSMSAKTFEDYAKAHPNELFHCSQGPNDALYIPAGWVFYEKVGKAADFVGLRRQLLCVAALPILEAIDAHLIAVGKPNELVQASISGLSMMAPDPEIKAVPAVATP
jgi:hypothetical protein